MRLPLEFRLSPIRNMYSRLVLPLPPWVLVTCEFPPSKTRWNPINILWLGTGKASIHGSSDLSLRAAQVQCYKSTRVWHRATRSAVIPSLNQTGLYLSYALSFRMDLWRLGLAYRDECCRLTWWTSEREKKRKTYAENIDNRFSSSVSTQLKVMEILVRLLEMRGFFGVFASPASKCLPGNSVWSHEGKKIKNGYGSAVVPYWVSSTQSQKDWVLE